MDGFKRPRAPEARPQNSLPPQFQPPRPASGQPAGSLGSSSPFSPPTRQPASQFRQNAGGQFSQPAPSNLNNTLPDINAVEREDFDALEQDDELDRPRRTAGKKPRRSRKKWIFLAILALLAAAIAGAYFWYNAQLKAVSNDATKHSFVVDEDDATATVAAKLKSAGLIRDEWAFQIYVRLEGKAIMAGTCRLTPAQTVAQIVDKLSKGCHDFKAVTFYPGGTLEASHYKASRSPGGVDKTNARYILKQAGFSDSDITAAFRAKYDSPLFADKPANISLEGYIFGETYHVAEDATAKDVLETVFAHMYKVVQKNDLEAKFKAQGLNLYQGIVLASIVERELTCEDKPTAERKERCYQYQRGIAQVFIKRFRDGVKLGSDITAVYAADKSGIDIPKDDTNMLISIDSPYNTRKYEGLPPTPIAAPGELSLRAVANPTATENNFFLAGDDGLIYFAKTNEEHEANIKNHCQKLCAAI